MKTLGIPSISGLGTKAFFPGSSSSARASGRRCWPLATGECRDLRHNPKEMTVPYRTRTAQKLRLVGNPWDSPEMSCKNAIWTIMRGVQRSAFIRRVLAIFNMPIFCPWFFSTRLSTRRRSKNWKEAAKYTRIINVINARSYSMDEKDAGLASGSFGMCNYSPANVITQTVLPTGAPKFLFRTLASLECHVHQINFAPAETTNSCDELIKKYIESVFLLLQRNLAIVKRHGMSF